MFFFDELEEIKKNFEHDRDMFFHVLIQKLQSWITTDAEGLFNHLREHNPILNLPGVTLLTRYDDVVEVLQKDEVFSVRLYTPKMERIAGPFILGMENGPTYQHDVKILRGVMRGDDAPRIEQISSEVVSALLQPHLSKGQIELVHQLTLLAPARTICRYFGLPIRNEAELLRWARTIFDDIFANLSDDPIGVAAANRSSQEIKAYLDEVITARQIALNNGNSNEDTVLDRLLQLQKGADPQASFDNTVIRNNFIGLIAGAIDTTSKAAIHVIVELLNRPDQTGGVRQAVRDTNKLQIDQYVKEALRFRPQNTFLVRYCEKEYTVASGTDHATTIKPGTKVFAANSAAMLDKQLVANPDQFQRERPDSNYIHFGTGLHSCAGRYISPTIIREIVRQLFSLDNLRATPQIEYEGIYPDVLTVTFDPPASQSAEH